MRIRMLKWRCRYAHFHVFRLPSTPAEPEPASWAATRRSPHLSEGKSRIFHKVGVGTVDEVFCSDTLAPAFVLKVISVTLPPAAAVCDRVEQQCCPRGNSLGYKLINQGQMYIAARKLVSAPQVAPFPRQTQAEYRQLSFCAFYWSADRATSDSVAIPPKAVFSIGILAPFLAAATAAMIPPAPAAHATSYSHFCTSESLYYNLPENPPNVNMVQ